MSLAADDVSEFMTPIKAVLYRKNLSRSNMLLTNDDFRDQVSVTEEDVRAAYDTEVEQSATESERRARHPYY